LRIYFPLAENLNFVFFISRNFRQHFPQTSEILEYWFERSAEKCDRFVNIIDIDKFSVTCTVCSSFEVGCSSPEGPSIIKLLETARVHDGGHQTN